MERQRHGAPPSDDYDDDEDGDEHDDDDSRDEDEGLAVLRVVPDASRGSYARTRCLARKKKRTLIIKSVYFLVESRRHAQPKVRPDSSAPILTSFQIFLC